MIKIDSHPRNVVESLDKVLYDNYLGWWLQTSSVLTGKKSKKQLENLKIGNS